MRAALAGVVALGAVITPGVCASGVCGLGTDVAHAAEAPKRVVAAGGALTEILYALGLADRVVGVDTTSTFPASALKEKAQIGYVRQLSPEGILSLQPDVLLVQEGAGPPSALALVEQAGVRIVKAPEASGEQAVIDRIHLVGELMQAKDKSDVLAASVSASFTALREKRQRIDRPTRVMFVLSLQNGRPL
ncbi:hypothetical protein OSTOST_14275, partial [Ostertagia ostertagi]